MTFSVELSNRFLECAWKTMNVWLIADDLIESVYDKDFVLEKWTHYS